MPPYSQMPGRIPPRRGLIVQVHICDWCKERVAHKCNSCGLLTCYMCLHSNEGGRCVHQAYRPVQSDGWGEECPNPQCDKECNVCMGRGIVHTVLQRRLRS